MKTEVQIRARLLEITDFSEDDYAPHGCAQEVLTLEWVLSDDADQEEGTELITHE